MLDLFNVQYDRETLKKHIYSTNLLDILKTQKIDVTFAVRYLLNTNYHLHDEYSMITPELIIQLQPHITMKELRHEIVNYDNDDDSVDGFDKYLNK